MKVQCMKEDVWKSFFSLTCWLASRNFIIDKLLQKWFSGILSTWAPSNSYFFFLYKMFEKHMWNTCLLYVVVEVWQLVNEISSFPEVLCERGDLKNFSKFTDKHKTQSSGGVLTKDVLKNFAKFTDKHLCPSLFFNKAVGWKPETVRSSHWRCSVRKGVFKKERWCFKISPS